MTKTYTSLKQCFQGNVSITMNFIKHVLTEFIEVHPTSKLYWPSNKIYCCGRCPTITICTSTYGLAPVLCNRLLIKPSGWARTVHMFTQRFTYHVTQYSCHWLNAFFFLPFCACIYDLAEPYLFSFRQ